MENKKTRWELYKEKNGSTPLDALNPMSAKCSDQIAEQRFNTCLSCPKLFKLTLQCKECGCFMKAKVKLEKSKCPDDLWKK